MAKARKQKNEDQQKNAASTCCAIVSHQKLCLAIDMENQRIYGHTELKIMIPDSGVIGLHASNMNIDSVLVNGVPVLFKYNPRHENDQSTTNSHQLNFDEAAEMAGSSYHSLLEKEIDPELLIFCETSTSFETSAQGNTVIDSAIQKQDGDKLNESSTNKQVQNVQLVRIEYWLEKPEAGVHFTKNTLHTHSQLRRARCWFPCIDCWLQCCCYDLEFTVNAQHIAVSNGNLLYQVVSKDDPPCRTFVYKIDIPIPAESVALVVGPFDALTDHHNQSIYHICKPIYLSDLECTVGFFHNVFSYYEEYLGTTFPFGSYKQVFIDSESVICSVYAAASVSIFSSDLLYNECIIDQVIKTRIKLAHALAKQWFGIYIIAENENDGWLLQGLAGFLTDCCIKRFLGNNEARYRRFKANEAVCKVDVDGATALSSSAAVSEVHGTHVFGVLGKIRSWKAVAVLQMLEKQMGPEAFRKILQRIMVKAKDSKNTSRTLSTKEFRHLANKIGNLERPFLKEFFPRWVETFGCPVLRMGFSYNKKRNILELAVLRGCTSSLGPNSELVSITNGDTPSGDEGWPGMMSIRVYELDGMFDHPSLPMAGDTYQLLELQCHSKLAARRVQRPKKGGRAEGSDDNVEIPIAMDSRTGIESPLLWLRADPEMEYLAMINMNQPVHMWINQLERERDIVGQLQAINILSRFPQSSLTVINALNSCLTDPKVFWRVRVEAAFALAKTACEDVDLTGLKYLIEFYKSRRFDMNIGLPRPNDFSDFSEYFILEAIPNAIATVRGPDGKTPIEAVTFILQLLQYNDNNGNHYSDAYWRAALVDSIGRINFGQQSIEELPAFLKHIDSILQFDRFMPSYNRVLTISAIRTLRQTATNLFDFIPLEPVKELLKVWGTSQNTLWQIRVEVIKAHIDLEAQKNGLGAALLLAVKFINEEFSLRVQTKISMHCLQYACQSSRAWDKGQIYHALPALLGLLQSQKCFINVYLRHHIFSILQILAGRSASLFGLVKPKVQPTVKPMGIEVAEEQKAVNAKQTEEQKVNDENHECKEIKPEIHKRTNIKELPVEGGLKSNSLLKLRLSKHQEANGEHSRINSDGVENVKGVDAMVYGSTGGNNERKVSSVKLRIKPLESAKATAMKVAETSAASADERGITVFPVTSSSVSVDTGRKPERSLFAPGDGTTESISSQKKRNLMKLSTAGSFGKASFPNVSTSSVRDCQEHNTLNDVQCTADSKNVGAVKLHTQIPMRKEAFVSRQSADVLYNQNAYINADSYNNPSSKQNGCSIEAIHSGHLESIQLSTGNDAMRTDQQNRKDEREHRKEKKHKHEKRTDPEYLEQKRLKKEKRERDPHYLEQKRLKKEKRRQEKERLKRMESASGDRLADTQKSEVEFKCTTVQDTYFKYSSDVQIPQIKIKSKRTETADLRKTQRFPEPVQPAIEQSSWDVTDANFAQRPGSSQKVKPSTTMKFKLKK